MSTTLRRDASPWWIVQGLALLWGVAVLLAYGERADVATPVLALGDRLLDWLAPLLVVAPAIGVASRICSLSLQAHDDDSGAGSLDHLLYSILIALGLWVTAILILGIVGCLTPVALLTVALGLGVGSVVCFRREWSPLSQGFRSVGELLQTPAGGIVALFLALSCLTTLTPAVSQDALHYHLEVPRNWLSSGEFSEVPGNVYSRFPMNIELLFLSALAVRGEIAAKAFHWWLCVVSTLAVIRVARHWVDRRSAVWGGVIFLAIPTVFRVSTWAYVEMGVVASLLLAWNLLLLSPLSNRRFLLLGYALGFACGVKYTLLPVALMLAIVAVWRCRPRVAVLLGAVALAHVGGGFWYWRNLMQLGNPVFPFLYSTFGGAGWDNERAELFMASLAEWGRSGWDLPLALTFDATFASVTAFDGILGPVFLLAAPLVPLAAWRFPETRWTLGLCAVLATSWLLATRQMRFLLPCLALLAAVIPAGWSALRLAWARRMAHSLVVVGVVLSLMAPLLIICNEAPLAFALGLESAQQVRQRNLAGGDAELFEQLQQWVPENGKVLFAASGNPVFLCSRPYHADSVVENYTLRASLQQANSPAEWQRYMQRRGFTHLLFRFGLVFGSRSDLTDREQVKLAESLNAGARLKCQVDDTRLYEILPLERLPQRGGER